MMQYVPLFEHDEGIYMLIAQSKQIGKERNGK